VTGLLQDYASRAAERDPSAVALVMGDQTVTYGEIESRSNQLARLLLAHGCGPGDRICLFAEKSPAAIVAMHAVLKAGGAYVPIDLASPAPRIAKIVRASEPRLVLASTGGAPTVGHLVSAGWLGAPVGLIEADHASSDGWTPIFEAADWTSAPAGPLAPTGSPTSIAHLLFTSGSTGVPKGVAITHANVVSFLEWAGRYFRFRSDGRHSGHPPLHFDLSTFDIYGTFAAGAELHLVPVSLSLDARALAEFIREHELTQWFSVPSVLTYLAKFNAITHDDFPSLERLLWCGEVLPIPVLEYWMERLPHVQFTNLYGPTETTIASSYYTVPGWSVGESQTLPIGTACDGEELLVLDSDRMPLPVGEIGEIFIAGVGLSPGYWRDPARTDAAFLADRRSGRAGQRIYRTGDLGRVRDDGLVEFLGRVDSQIKSRGYRIELGEVEAALNEIAGVRESAVVGVDSDGFEGSVICCGYAPVPGCDLAPSQVRSALAKVLPNYMLPSRWRSFAALPKNMNGKIDRRAIRESFEAEREAHPSLRTGR
jgi:amino acid adenylation domain-containing protein